MNFDLADLRAFVAVADLGSFGQAAKAINLSQPALSRRVEKLESSLGVKLFERTTRKVELTPTGRAFLESARHVLNELQTSLLGSRDLAQRMSGEINIACVPSAVRYFLPSVIHAFHARFPRMRIRIADETASEILVAVARGQADLGLTYMGTKEPDIDFEPVFEEQFVVACLRNHPLASRKQVAWGELAEYEYMTVAQGSVNRTLMDMALMKSDRQPTWYCEVRHIPALVSLIEAGLGVGVVPRLALPLEEHPRLVGVPISEPALSRTLGLVTRHGRPLPPAAREFHEMLRASLRENETLRQLAASTAALGRSGQQD